MPSFDSENLEKLIAAAPHWRREQMLAAHLVFESLEEPTGAEEDWRYVQFETPFSSLTAINEPGAPMGGSPFLASVDRTSGRVLIVDGAILEASSNGDLVKRFADLSQKPTRDVLVPVDHNKLAAAHAAFSIDGALIEIPKGAVIADPLVIEIQGVTPHAASFPHVIVQVGENAEASVLVVYRSADDTRLLMVPEIDLQVAAGGRLRYLAVQGLDQAATSVVHQRVTVGRDATARIGEVGLGAKLGRLDLGIDLNGDGSSSEVVGLYFGEGKQTLDYRMVVTHHGKSTTSDVFLKGAVEDDAQSVFTGLLRIEKDARGTSTFETNRNLVLSENAKAQSVPNLEILCDDVVCGHGSSVGPLEQEHLYYLQSRGLTRGRAERLLIRGFFQEVIDRLPIEAVGGPVSDEVFRRFVSAQEEGRVA